MLIYKHVSIYVAQQQEFVLSAETDKDHSRSFTSSRPTTLLLSVTGIITYLLHCNFPAIWDSLQFQIFFPITLKHSQGYLCHQSGTFFNSAKTVYPYPLSTRISIVLLTFHDSILGEFPCYFFNKTWHVQLPMKWLYIFFSLEDGKLHVNNVLIYFITAGSCTISCRYSINVYFIKRLGYSCQLRDCLTSHK